MSHQNKHERCDRCHRHIDADASEMGWPVLLDDRYVCASCYGDEAFCVACGEMLPAHMEGDKCSTCMPEEDDS